MKKFYASLMAIALIGFMFVGVVQAASTTWQTTSVPEMAAHRGATHCVVIKWSDLAASTDTNTAYAFTNAILAKTGVEFVELMLDKAFDTANTNYTGSVLLKVGDGSDDDLFLTSTELASDGTEVWIKYGPPNAATVVSTVTAATTNMIYLGPGDTTNTIAVMTNATVASAATAGELGRKLYASAGSLVFTLTPNAEEALSANTSGEVRMYLRLTKFGQ